MDRETALQEVEGRDIQSEWCVRQYGKGELPFGMSAVEEDQLGAFSASEPLSGFYHSIQLPSRDW